jgi:hypothetical protein
MYSGMRMRGTISLGNQGGVNDMDKGNSEKAPAKKYLRIGVVIAGLFMLSGVTYRLIESNPISDLYGTYPDGTKLEPLKVSNANAPRPNVIIILCDDLGYGDLASYGGRAIETPNIDRLALGGMRFTDYYACSAVCAPSRAGLLTGRYPFRTGIIGNPYPESDAVTKKIARKIGSITRPFGTIDIREDYVAEGLSPAEITLAEALKSAGISVSLTAMTCFPVHCIEMKNSLNLTSERTRLD